MKKTFFLLRALLLVLANNYIDPETSERLCRSPVTG